MFELLHSKKAKSSVQAIEIAQPLFYDGLLATSAAFDKGMDNNTKWKWLDENIKYAFATTNSIVWFYSQRINWWKGKVNDTLFTMLQRNKMAYSKDNDRIQRASKNKNEPADFSCDNINSQKGYYYIADPKEPMKTGNIAFVFTLDKAQKKLYINFTDSVPVSVHVYANNILINNTKAQKKKITLNIPEFTKGRLVILAKYEGKSESSGIQVVY